jgi:hypothetical protein
MFVWLNEQYVMHFGTTACSMAAHDAHIHGDDVCNLISSFLGIYRLNWTKSSYINTRLIIDLIVAVTIPGVAAK